MTWDHCKGHKRPRRGSGAERSPSPPHTDLSSSVQTQGLGSVTVSAVLQSSCNVTYVNLTSLWTWTTLFLSPSEWNKCERIAKNALEMEHTEDGLAVPGPQKVEVSSAPCSHRKNVWTSVFVTLACKRPSCAWTGTKENQGKERHFPLWKFSVWQNKVVIKRSNRKWDLGELYPWRAASWVFPYGVVGMRASGCAGFRTLVLPLPSCFPASTCKRQLPSRVAWSKWDSTCLLLFFQGHTPSSFIFHTKFLKLKTR